MLTSCYRGQGKYVPGKRKRRSGKDRNGRKKRRGGTKRMIGDRVCRVPPKPMFEDRKSLESLRAYRS